MPQIGEVIKEDAAAMKQVMSESDTAKDMKEKVGPEIRDEIKEDVDAARNVVSDVAGDIKEKVDPNTDDHERTLFEKITDPMKETMSDASEFVKNIFYSK